MRRCPLHGPLVGVRYCPECASSGKPWTEAYAGIVDHIEQLERTAAADVLRQLARQIGDEPEGDTRTVDEIRDWLLYHAEALAAGGGQE